MVKFAHLADCHLGGWKQQPLQEINFQSFRKAIETCINEKVDFVLIAGDLFDSAYPPIEILKETFSIFKKLKESRIPCYIIAGSHDYSVSGKTFLDVLEKAGFCENVEKFEEKDGKIFLIPRIYGNIAIYGYPGKRSGLEIQDLKKVKFNDTPGLFKIFMLHTTMSKVKGSLPIECVYEDELPYADYYALGHIHVDFQYGNFVYPSPIFPNNFKELEDLHHGGFYIVETNALPGEKARKKLTRIELKIKDVESFDIQITNSLTATNKIISELNSRNLENKIILLRIKGDIETGKNSDINFIDIENFVREKKAYFLIRNTHDLKTKDFELKIETKDSENIEDETIKRYLEDNKSNFNKFIPQLMNTLSLEKQEDEKTAIFENRLLDEVKKILNF